MPLAKQIRRTALAQLPQPTMLWEMTAFGEAIRPIRSVVFLLLACYALFLGACAAFQRRLIYFPTRMPEAMALNAAGAMGLEAWRGTDGRLLGWRSAEPVAYGTCGALVLFHGNGGQALDRGHYLDALFAWKRPAPLRLYLFEYPGYGAVPGRPSEKAIVACARHALELVQAEHPNGPVILAGESLGSGVAAALAREVPTVDGLILITPFDTLASVGQRGMPFLPVGLLLIDRYDSVRNLASYTGRVAVIVAGRDQVIPPHHARRLYDALNPEAQKRWWLEPQAGHNSLDPFATWWSQALEFAIWGAEGQDLPGF